MARGIELKSSSLDRGGGGALSVILGWDNNGGGNKWGCDSVLVDSDPLIVVACGAFSEFFCCPEDAWVG